jgi:ribosomal protein L29
MKSTAEMKSLKELSVGELEKKLVESRTDLFSMRMKLADPTAPLADVAGIGAARRRIARINTLINAKKREGGA